MFISHKLDEVMRDRRAHHGPARRARHRRRARRARRPRRELARLMVGRELPASRPSGAAVERGASAAASSSGSRGPGIHGHRPRRPTSARSSGVAGVAGNGQSELAELIAGLLPVTSGGPSARRARRDRAPRSRERRDAGLAYVPDDRFRRGLAADASIARQPGHGRPPAPAARASRAARRRGRRARIGADLVRALRGQGRPASTTRRASLSGGNAQRLVIARELGAERPRHRRRAAHAGHRHRRDPLRARRAARAPRGGCRRSCSSAPT